jgi:hypothetical protein
LLTDEEKRFVAYWEANRNRSKQRYVYFIIGLSVGLIAGLLIFGSIITNWYQRATMVANGSGLGVLPYCVVIIAAFMAYFYQNFRWEQNEARYQSFKAREEKQDPQPDNKPQT